ncbi:MAG: hypothetical protein HC918_09885 [Oscillatoriales cyanobacterium SM2_1_8]|nr:hypothetical protein [Oscillatoriales cyanobacterium SM2_1_8]
MNSPSPRGVSPSTTLWQFREAIKDALTDITTIEVTTALVDRISPVTFSAEDFYERLQQDLACRTPAEIQQWRNHLEARQQELTAMLTTTVREQPEAKRIWQHHHLVWQRQVQHLRAAEQRLQSPAALRQDWEEFYQEASTVLQRLHAEGKAFYFGSVEVSALRKLWETYTALANGEQIYASTHLRLDGDTVERYRRELFDREAFDAATAQALLTLHRESVTRARERWNDLVAFLLGLVERLIPYRDAQYQRERSRIDGRR